MERFLLFCLQLGPRYPAWARYLMTLGLVGLSLGLTLGLRDQLSSFPFALFVPAIFVASIVFDSGSGFLATLAGAILAARYLMPAPREVAILPLVVFLLTGFGIAAVTEALRGTLQKLAKSKSYAEVLFEELAHRTKNDLTTIISILRLQARSDSNPAVQAALTSAMSRIEVVAKVHDRLRDSSGGQNIQLAPYVETLCEGLADLHRDVRPIAIRVHCENVSVKSSQAASIGLIVNELVTNAFKYAFPGERLGAIEVEIRRAVEQNLMITVKDDGVGCPTEVRSGLGTRLIGLLTSQMKGSMIRTPLPRGCQVQVTVMLDG